MKYDEFAFFNQQLAAMLREGLPLEGALQQLCANMSGGLLRSELELLEADLKNGIPLDQAIGARRLPEFYVQMIKVGVQSNDLPGVLLMLADYYQRVDSVWTKLKGLLVYPLIVLVAAFALSSFLSVVASHVVNSDFLSVMGVSVAPLILANLWAPPILIGLLLATVVFILVVPAWRRGLRWRVPAFKEAKLAQVAGAMSLMLKSGGNLSDALGLVREMEAGTTAGNEMGKWQGQLAQGRGRFSEMAAPGGAFPPLFLWLVGNAGEDLAAGFRRAAEIYDARANHRIEILLYAALPFSVLALGIMICCQIIPVIGTFVSILNGIS